MNSIVAQSEFIPFECGITDDPIESTPQSNSSSSDCFDPNYIIDNEIEIWLRVHIHLFLDDNCEGDYLPWLGAGSIDQNEIWPAINTYFDGINEIMSNLNVAWVDPLVFGMPQATQPAFMPVRFYLDGITTHCDNARQNDGWMPDILQDTLGLPNTLNVFITESPGSAGGNAILNKPGSTVEDLDPGNFIHEAMHSLGLRHSFEDDRVDDTPEKRFNFDYNLDGDTNDNFPTSNPDCKAIGRESFRTCWAKENQDDYLDYDGDCIDDYTLGSVDYPCASWSWQSNNLMGYGSYKISAPALTSGQVRKALEGILNNYCDYIEAIGTDCPPANAHVEAYSDPEFCGIRVYTGLSQNNDRYRLTIKDASTGNIVWQGGWVNGAVPAFLRVGQRYDIKTGNFIPGQPFYDNTEYEITLETDGPCGDDDLAITTVISDLNCNYTSTPIPAVGAEVMIIGQNPTEVNIKVFGDANVNYTVALSDDLQGEFTQVENGNTGGSGEAYLSLSSIGIQSGEPFTVTVIDQFGFITSVRTAKH